MRKEQLQTGGPDTSFEVVRGRSARIGGEGAAVPSPPETHVAALPSWLFFFTVLIGFPLYLVKPHLCVEFNK